MRQLGWHTLAAARATPSDRPANRPAIRDGSMAFVPVPSPLTPTLPKRGSGPFSGLRHPKVTSTRLGSPVPVGVALSGTGHRLEHASHQVKGYFRIHRVLPRTFPLRTGNVSSSTVHTQCCPQVGGHVDERRGCWLDVGRDLADLCRRRDHHHSVVHVALRVHAEAAHRAASCVLGAGVETGVPP